MSKEVSFKNRDRYIQLGVAISTIRKLRGMSQDKLAEKVNVSRSHISAIEAPGMVRSLSLELLYDIADALEVRPFALLLYAEMPEKLLNGEIDLSCLKI